MLRAYPLEGRTLVAFFEKGDVIMLRSDLSNIADCGDSLARLRATDSRS